MGMEMEIVFWDAFLFGERTSYLGMTGQGLVEMSLASDDFDVFVREVERRVPGAKLEHSEERLADTKRQIAEYLAGERTEFDLQLDLRGTAFQKSVWQELLKIPFGQTRSYLDIARSLGKEAAVRAVGGACGANPVPIIVPCHRVLGKTGKLTGFTGGLHLKETMLSLEGIGWKN